MPISRYLNPHRYTVAGPDGLSIELLPGEIVGALFVAKHLDRARNCTEESGLTRLTFAFRSDEGRPILYGGILSPYAYLPAPGCCVDLNPTDMKREVSMRALLDSRDTWTFRDTNGNADSLRLKYADAAFELSLDVDVIHVRLKIHQEVAPDGAHSVYRSLGYQLPIEHFLWRPAAHLLEDDIALESCPYAELALQQQFRKEIPTSSIRVLS